jgi:hypothetical protein
MAMTDGPLSAEDFGPAFKAFLEQAIKAVPAEEPFFISRLRDHFGTDPSTLPIVREEFESSDHPNLQVAIDSFLEGEGRSADVFGVSTGLRQVMGMSFSDLLTRESPAPWGSPRVSPGPVEYMNVHLDEDRVLACIQLGLLLIDDDGRRLAALVKGPQDRPFGTSVVVEAMGRDVEDARGFLGEVRTLMRKHNVYRGHVVSLAGGGHEPVTVTFHRLPPIQRDHIILPSGVLDRAERHTLGFGRHADAIRRAGRHLKRGLLFHGPPGTGKTLTVMYLAEEMRNRTVILLTGRALRLIEPSCAMARILQPSMVVLEDADLVAEERTARDRGAPTALLFELLNQMDGLEEDADIVFLLTTNRADLLEPALAARPGRIDQAVEFSLPDSEARRRLLQLYAQGLDLRVQSLDPWVERTKGVSPAFIRELLRKAAVFAIDETGDAVVEDHHLDEALHDLVIEGGELTKSLLGASRSQLKS